VGGLSETEALALVTINPAQQLGIADRVGSIEKGKDADLAIFDRDPLSIYARGAEDDRRRRGDVRSRARSRARPRLGREKKALEEKLGGGEGRPRGAGGERKPTTAEAAE
jgi:cytosine/adenosine deaminase-related metal-dependent hydrolase